jgi:xylulokinase
MTPQDTEIVSRGYPISFPRPGWSEQKPEDWLRATLESIRALTGGCDKAQIAVSAPAPMHGLVALDKEDNVLRRPSSGTTALRSGDGLPQ